MYKPVIFAILLLCIHAFSDISGVVFDSFTKKPISDCEVKITGTELSQRTNSNGEFHFKISTDGSYNLIFRHKGYVAYTKNDVYLSGLKNEYLHIDLEPIIHNLENITVTAKAGKKNPEMVTSTGTFLNSELMRAPGALADVQRIVQNLPGVVSGADNVNEVIVRGGMKNENQFLIDNIDVLNPNHFADEGSGGGVLSLLNPLLVQKLVFNAGAPPANYGGKASSVIDVTLRDGNNEQVLAGIDLGVTGAGAHVEGPMWKKSNFIISANKSYLDLVSKFEPGTAVPKYWGIQGKFKQSLKNSTLSLLSLYGDSYIDIENGKETQNLTTDYITSGSSNFLGGVNWERKFSNRIHTNLTFSTVKNGFSNLGYNIVSTKNDTVFYNRTSLMEYTLKLESEFLLNDFLKIKSGVFGKNTDADILRINKTDTLYIYQNNLKTAVQDSSGNYFNTVTNKSDKLRTQTAGGFVSSSLYLEPGIKLITGVRAGYLKYTHETTVDPRIGFSYMLNDKITINSSFGIQSQFPDNSDLILQLSANTLKAKKAITGIFGVDYTPSFAGITVNLEAFYKKYNNLYLDYLYDFDNQQFNFLRGYHKTSFGEGKSYGIEFFSEKKLTKNWSYSLAYSHSRSYWRYNGEYGSDWFRGDYDYRNVFTATGGYKFELTGKSWYETLKRNNLIKVLYFVLPFADRQEFSIKFRYRGGRPYTPYFYDTLYQRWSYRVDELNSAEMEPYHRLDLRWERRYSYGPVKAIFYFEVQNLYNQKNIWIYLYDDQNVKPSKIYQLPIFPSGGFIIGF